MRSLTGGHLKAGFDSVRGAKLRSFWTMLGVIVGVASVVSVVAIGNGIKQQIGGQIHHYGVNLITVRPTQFELDSGSSVTNSSALSGLAVSGTLSAKDVQTVTHVPGLAASAPLTIAGTGAKGENGIYRQGFVIGTTSALPSLLNQSLSSGSFIDSDDMNGNVVVLGQHAAEEMFNQDVPLGRTLTFRGEEFIVVGIFNQFTTSPLSQQANFNDAIFIPHSVAERLTNNTAPTYQILARPKNADMTDKIVDNMQAALNKTHGGDSGFSVQSGNQNLDSNNTILDLLTRLIAGVAAISLLVGGIGIMNVMLVSVGERMHEIGIRKAVGATNGQILSQFMLESSILSLIGGVIGVVVAILIDLGLRATTSLTPLIDWKVVLLATGVSLCVGVVFGSVPAFKAAHKDPIDALRSE